MSNNTHRLFEYVDNDANSWIDSELICIICNQPFDDPRCTPCDHLFCAYCITHWIEQGNYSCPTCRSRVSLNRLTLANRPLRHIVDRLPVKCLTCGESGIRRDAFDDHLRQSCSSVQVRCPAADILCPWLGSRRELNSHRVECLFEPLREILEPVLKEYRQLKEEKKKKNEQFQQRIGPHQIPIVERTNGNDQLRQLQNDSRTTPLTTTIDHPDESFLWTGGEGVMLLNHGSLCQRPPNKARSAIAIGRNLYSSPSRIRLQIEDGWVFVGILSETTHPFPNINEYPTGIPLLQSVCEYTSLDSMGSVHGWWTTGWRIQNGKQAGMYSNEQHQVNDVYELILNGNDTDQHCSLNICNQRTNRQDTINISLKDVPLPWRLVVIFGQRGGRVRIA